MRTFMLAALIACSPPPAPKAPGPRTSDLGPPLKPASVEARSPKPEAQPPARTQDTVDRQFGLEVHDPYRWMEGTDNRELHAWLVEQGARAEQQLAKLPERAALRARVSELGLGVAAVFDVQLGGERTFYKQVPAGEQLANLVVRDRDGKDRVLVAPAALSTPEHHVAVHAYAASLDGKLVAYVLAAGGGEVGTLHVMDVATGKDLPDQIDRIWGEGSAAWLADGRSFFYTQLAEPQPGVDPMANQLARLHRLGEPVERDVTILGRGPGATMKLAPEEWPGLWAPPGTGYVLAFVGGAHSEQRVAIAKLSALDLSGAGKTPWRELCGYADGIETAVVHGDRVYMTTFAGAPNRKLISVPIGKPDLAKARVEIAERADAPLVSASPAKDAIYLVHRVDGRARLSRWPWRGKPTDIALPEEGWIPDIATDLRRDGITFQLETWLHPGSYFRFERQQLAPTHLASTTTADVSRVAVDEVQATSADGTHVPLTILHGKDVALDGSHPALLYGYGAYGASQSPGFSATRLAWIERGGVIAIAHVRGGGERGRRWQDDGSRDKKMNGIRDFIACGQYLVDRHYTTPGKLAAIGGSMGGILVGRAITERPDLFAAANIAVGFVDPLRLLAAENGANQKLELGDPETEAGYKALYEMDPYQHVKPGTAYPAVIFTVGLNDHRVAPWMTAKMAARLLASTTSGKPILIRVESDAGHGIGSTRDQTFAERADVWAFFLDVFSSR
ncbi:MAG: prolyl oligopeptidase family serine peptidase [Acidobacteriota bacterium]